MASYSHVVIVGNITRDPELRHTPSGTAVCDISIAVNDRRKDLSGNWNDRTSYIDCVLWSRTAEVAVEYLRKGSPVLIDGRLEMETWEKDGQKRSKLRVVAENMRMLGGKGQAAGGDEATQQSKPKRERQPAGDDDPEVPF